MCKHKTIQQSARARGSPFSPSITSVELARIFFRGCRISECHAHRNSATIVLSFDPRHLHPNDSTVFVGSCCFYVRQRVIDSISKVVTQRYIATELHRTIAASRPPSNAILRDERIYIYYSDGITTNPRKLRFQCTLPHGTLYENYLSHRNLAIADFTDIFF